jgi:hypothetical protein
MLVDLLFGLATAVGDSDDGGIDLDNDLLDNGDELEEPGSMDEPSPPVRVAYPQPHPPFDMVDFMHKSSRYDMHKVFAVDDGSLPRHIPSERPGGEARREILKSRAADITQSVSEVFAFATSRTISCEDTAVVLETFGNVS